MILVDLAWVTFVCLFISGGPWRKKWDPKMDPLERPKCSKTPFVSLGSRSSGLPKGSQFGSIPGPPLFRFLLLSRPGLLMLALAALNV